MYKDFEEDWTGCAHGCRNARTCWQRREEANDQGKLNAAAADARYQQAEMDARLDEADYLAEVRASGGVSATRYVHDTGHTTYDSTRSHPMRYHASGYKTQTLDMTDHNAHWEGC